MEIRHATEDGGCLRWVMAVPLGILHLLAAGLCYSAWTIRPSGVRDRDAYAAITLLCFLTVAVSVIALVITVAPPTVRRALGPWWLVPSLILSVLATIRWVVEA